MVPPKAAAPKAAPSEAAPPKAAPPKPRVVPTRAEVDSDDEPVLSLAGLKSQRASKTRAARECQGLLGLLGTARDNSDC